MSTSPRVFTNTNPVRPYRGNGRPEAGYVIERMVDLAADELGIDPAELRRRNYISPAQMPFKTGADVHLRLRRIRKEHGPGAGAGRLKGFKKRREEARKRGKLRGIGISNTIERAAAAGTEGAEVRFDRSGIDDPVLRLGHRRAKATRPCSSSWSATGSALHPERRALRAGRHRRRCSSAKAPAARARPPCRARRFLMATDKVIAKAKPIAAHALQGRRRTR